MMLKRMRVCTLTETLKQKSKYTPADYRRAANYRFFSAALITKALYLPLNQVKEMPALCGLILVLVSYLLPFILWAPAFS
ncbi:hypothetical protein I2I11_03605 [Pontibacter sp. 172403-2]|uniref:hypothetical protein n=1 Tax=Pontibacter rufus TaxID=2791028 RepID=UPI0018AF5F0B|nr:hypothetical protein [Pontibacter sp. 172403-2]MBF9252370.1 hypothetical protein [Pontibacter sp. 172403-2]